MGAKPWQIKLDSMQRHITYHSWATWATLGMVDTCLATGPGRSLSRSHSISSSWHKHSSLSVKCRTQLDTRPGHPARRRRGWAPGRPASPRAARWSGGSPAPSSSCPSPRRARSAPAPSAASCGTGSQRWSSEKFRSSIKCESFDV